MSCNLNKCVFVPRSSFTSALFKVLVTLKLLHGSRTGAKGSTLEDIAMHMIKHFCLDGDIKSQVLASLKYGVKMHFIQKKKEKFSLILPASSIHLAPCKFKNEETERIQCIFPPEWYGNSCDDVCGGSGTSCCGKRKRGPSIPCCRDNSDDEGYEEDGEQAFTPLRRPKAICGSGHSQSRGVCPSHHNSKRRKRSQSPCPKAKPPVCGRRSGTCSRAGSSYGNDDDDDLCRYCETFDNDDQSSVYNYSAYKNCACCQK